MTALPYYSQRHGGPTLRDQHEIGERFWTAFSGYIAELDRNDYFAGALPEDCPDGNGVCSWEPSLLSSRMAGELPEGQWPLPKDVPPKETVFDYIEFFYRIISVPDGVYHGFFRHYDYHSFDKGQARSEYTSRINQYLQNCRHPYDFIDGEVKSSVSPVLDEPIREEEFVLSDHYLQDMLESAVRDFHDKSGAQKQKALQTLVDAYERLKSVEDPDNKRQSVEATISKVSTLGTIRTALNDDMKALTDVANEFTIRHHEVSKRRLDDEDFIEYLFYAYYNIIRLVLKKYGQVRSHVSPC